MILTLMILTLVILTLTHRLPSLFLKHNRSLSHDRKRALPLRLYAGERQALRQACMPNIGE